MQAEYRRDTHHSYLVLCETENSSRPAFQTRMFLENSVPGFLPCRMYDIDCSRKYFYDISSRQSLTTMLETRPLDGKSLEALLASVLKGLNGLQMFLLDTDGFCLKEDWIFADPSGSEFLFCYFPEGELNWKEQLLHLAEYLLPRLEHKNREAVRLGYDFYQWVMQDRITATELELLLGEFRSGKEEEKEKKERKEEETYRFIPPKEEREPEKQEAVPPAREQLLNAFFEQEEPEKKEGAMAAAAAVLFPVLEWWIPLAAGCTGTYVLWYFGRSMAALACAAATAAVLVLLRLRRRRKDREQEQAAVMEPYMAVQDWMEEEKEEERLSRAAEAGNRQEKVEEPDEISPTCMLSGDAGVRRPARGYLIPTSDPACPSVAVVQKRTMIGKSSQMDVILPGFGISRVHARITCRGGQCFLTDLNSRNGTRVNGVLLKPEEKRLLSDGDRITFAGTEYQWKDCGG